MKVLLVTSTKKLGKKFSVLNSALEYCALVTNDDALDSVKKLLEAWGLPQIPIYPMSALKECIQNLDYDYLLRFQDRVYVETTMREFMTKKYNVQKNKVLSFSMPLEDNFKTECLLRYYKEHDKDFEMFATGISEAFNGIDVNQFKYKLINFAKPSQDLYYDFQIAKYAVLCGGGHSKLRYALIGLAPYSFHYDLSQVFRYRCLFLPYVIALNDLHNFFIPVDQYKKFLREEWLVEKLPLKNFDVTRPYGGGSDRVMGQKAINAGTNTWNRKNYPETRDENVKILDDYLTLCEKNNICPIMFKTPVTEKFMENFNPQLSDEFNSLIEQVLQKHPNAYFIDGWKLNLASYENFYDHEHMNIYGAAKFSAFLNDFIENLEKK